MKYINTFESFINEGRSSLDGLSSKLTSDVFKYWVKNYVGGEAKIEYETDVDGQLAFDLICTLHVSNKVKGFEILDSTGADGRAFDDDGDEQTPYIIIDFGINPEWLPGEWSTMYMYLSDTMRHEIEHITQDGQEVGNYRPGKPSDDDSQVRLLIKMGILPQSQYLMLPKEVDANLQGLRYESKKRRESMSDAVNRYLDTQEQAGVIDGNEREAVLDLWRRRAKKIGGIPQF